MRTILIGGLMLLAAPPATAAPDAQPKPEDTERWSPAVPVVTPGRSDTASPPSDADVLFDGGSLAKWVGVEDGRPARWTVADGVLTVDKRAGNIQTRRSFGSYQLHLEYRIPSGITGEGQARGNSGLFLASTGKGDSGYELQILDSYRNDTYVNGQAGSIYKQYAPLANPVRKPGDWQSVDVVWTKPTFTAGGALATPAYVTAFVNGVLVQDHVRLLGETLYVGPPRYKAYDRAPIKLQAHGDASAPISFRNIWVREPAGGTEGQGSGPRPATVRTGSGTIPSPLRVLTFNVRTTINVDDGREAWPKRRDLLAATIRAAHPDVIGTQELSRMQGDYIVRTLPAYSWFGIDREGGHADEHMGVFYNRERLDLLRQGNFWLSDTPEVPGSNSWHTPFPRMATWGLFEDRASHRTFYLFDTHLFYRDEDEPARTKGVRVLLDQMARIVAADVPVVLTGDFNTVPGSEAYRLVAARMTDIRRRARVVGGPEETFHNWTGKADKRIDWMFETGFTPLTDTTLTTHRDTLYPSDHFPVLATLGWQSASR